MIGIIKHMFAVGCFNNISCEAYPSGHVCRPAENPCDPVETCAGYRSEECPADNFRRCPPGQSG